MTIKSDIAIFSILLISILLLITPVQLGGDVAPIESLNILPNLPLFSLLFYLLVAVSLVFIYQKLKAKQSLTSALLCISLFSVVFLGFWVTATPWGRYPDDVVSFAHAQYILQNVRITDADTSGLFYFNWPGLPFLSAVLSSLSFAELALVRMMIVLVAVFVLPILFFFLSSHLLSIKLSILATFVFIVGDADLARTMNFDPGILGAMFFLVFLFVWKKCEQSNKWPNFVILTLLALCINVTYFPTAICLIVLALVFYLFEIRSKIKPAFHSLNVLLILIATTLIWNVNWASGQILASVDKVRLAFETNQLVFVQNATGGGIESVPLWANITQFSWLIIVYAIGTLYVVFSILRRRYTSTEAFYLAGFIAVSLFSIAIFAFSPQGSQLHRFLMYAPFFTVPLCLLCLSKLPKKKLIFSFLVLFLIVSSFPTFLVENKHFSTYAISKSDNAAYSYIGAHMGENLPRIFSQAYITWSIRYYVPGVRLVSEPPFFANQSNVWGELLNVYYFFENQTESRVFIMSNQSQQFVTVNFPESSIVDPDKQLFFDALSTKNRVYDDNYLQTYSP